MKKHYFLKIIQLPTKDYGIQSGFFKKRIFVPAFPSYTDVNDLISVKAKKINQYMGFSTLEESQKALQDLKNKGLKL
jgi:hypothetical protein